jgi:DNA (cytosine-5)-methyltransferase 1
MTHVHGELTGVSLFDGIGGFPEAMRRNGVRTVATVEIDKQAAGVTADRFPDAQHFDDVTKVTIDDILAAGFCPVCGIVCAGWPCQDLSLAGRRLGLGGARSGLFWEIVRLARGLRPRWLVLENVPGLLSAVCSCPGLGRCEGTRFRDPDTLRWTRKPCTEPHGVKGGDCGRRRCRDGKLVGSGRCMELHGGAMGAVLGALADLGYGFAYRVLDAQHFGVPQRRRRVVIVGCLGDWAAPAQVLLEPEGGAGNPAPGGEAGPGAASVADGRAPGARREVVSTLQSGGAGARGYRIDAEAAAGGQLIASSLTRTSITGTDDNTAQAGHLVVAEPEVWQQQGSKLQPMGTMRRGNGNVTGGVPFVAMPLTAREAKGPASDATNGNIIGFDLAQITSGENRSNPQPGGPQPPLAATGQPHVAQSLRGEGVRDLTAEGSDASEDGTGRGTPIIAFSETAGDIGTGVALRADPGGVGQGHNTNFVPEVASSVRRLTPVECERLQGYPDGWTATSNGKPQADAPRYRQLGNSIAVPVFEWVIRRLVAHEHS